MRVVAQHNLWFIGRPKYRNYRLQGKKMTSVDPLLGLTNSSDADVLRQEMQWLHRYTGRDGRNFVYSLQWMRPDNIIDRNLNAVFLPEIEKTKAKWHIFYDPVLAVRQRGLEEEMPIDFSRPKILKMFRTDLGYFWANYFDHPCYWKLRGKPVLYIWSVANGIRRAKPALEEARQQGLYLLGDVFGAVRALPPLDGHTGFVASTSDIHGRFTTVPAVMPIFEHYFEEHQTPGGPDLLPAVSPQYDDTNFRSVSGGRQTRVLAASRAEVKSFLELAATYSRRIGGSRYVWVGTTNNWAEGTTILPTARRGPEYLDGSTGIPRIGHYGFDHLEAIHDVLTPNEPRYVGPKIKLQKNGRVRFVDCDVLGKLKIKGSAVNLPQWRTGENLREHANGQRSWLPEAPQAVSLRFRNLDGRKTNFKLDT